MSSISSSYRLDPLEEFPLFVSQEAQASFIRLTVVACKLI